MVAADLHVHTTRSDGTLTLDGVPGVAREAGLSAVAITDHDRVHPGFDAAVVEREGVTLIRGIELRVEPDFSRVDLLGYGVEPTPDLRAEIDRIQRNRVERGRAIIERVEDRLGIDLDLEPREGFGRPHVARAIDEHPDVSYDYQGAFDDLIGDGGPCYVPRDVTSYATGRNLLAESCALVGLAHPLRHENPEAALSLADDLDAIERWYPYEQQVDHDRVEEAIERYDCLPTGGSDAHDDRLGRAGVPREAYESIRARLPEPG